MWWLISIAASLCPALSFRPQVFKLHGEEAFWHNPAPAEAQREHVLRAAAACPVQAIVVAWRDGSQTQISREAPCVTLEPGLLSKTAGAS